MTANFEWRRKVIQIKGTMYVCIPAIYAETINIKKGQELKLKLLEDGSLQMTPVGERK